MPFTNAQYNAVMGAYERDRSMQREAREARIAEVYEKIPAYRALEHSVSDLSARAAEQMLAGDGGSLAAYHEKLRAISAEKRQLLAGNGFPEDYTELRYVCPLCRDTGYTGSRRCECLNRRLRDLQLEQSNLTALFARNNFSVMRMDWYEGEDLRHFQSAVETCRNLIARFDAPEGGGSLMLFGSVGSGKTFLSVATAKELSDRGYAVRYFSAMALFETLAQAAFHAEEPEAPENLLEELTTCDLLVIDDLGTELTNAFVSSQLFHLINERLLKRRSTIISTNFNFEELRATYSDRILSRMLSCYTVCELTGADLRLRGKESA